MTQSERSTLPQTPISRAIYYINKLPEADVLKSLNNICEENAKLKELADKYPNLEEKIKTLLATRKETIIRREYKLKFNEKRAEINTASLIELNNSLSLKSIKESLEADGMSQEFDIFEMIYERRRQNILRTKEFELKKQIKLANLNTLTEFLSREVMNEHLLEMEATPTEADLLISSQQFPK